VTIQGFADATTEAFFRTGGVPRGVAWTRVAGVAARKLDMVDYAERLEDLRSPPGNRLEALKGSLLGHYSIRINRRWRVIFRWTPAGPTEVAIVDYH
jgi:proteic killer suppression protein